LFAWKRRETKGEKEENGKDEKNFEWIAVNLRN
jgi:hypothetical protein